jgi:hypothetical protein
MNERGGNILRPQLSGDSYILQLVYIERTIILLFGWYRRRTRTRIYTNGYIYIYKMVETLGWQIGLYHSIDMNNHANSRTAPYDYTLQRGFVLHQLLAVTTTTTSTDTYKPPFTTSTVPSSDRFFHFTILIPPTAIQGK